MSRFCLVWAIRSALGYLCVYTEYARRLYLSSRMYSCILNMAARLESLEGTSALADQTRLCILALLLHGGSAVIRILPGLPPRLAPPRLLAPGGLVSARREGLWVHYR